MAKVPVEAHPGAGFSGEPEGLFVNVLSVGWNGIEPPCVFGDQRSARSVPATAIPGGSPEKRRQCS